MLFSPIRFSYLPIVIEIPTQPELATTFTRLIDNGRLASSYLFYGPAGSGKWQAALELTKEVLSRKPDGYDSAAGARVAKLVHPDLVILFPMPSPKNLEERAEFFATFRESKLARPYLPVEFGRASNVLLEQVREFQENLYRSAVEGGYRVAIFEKAEMMPSTSFDILLKTIEEPPPDSLLLILTDNFDRLPETIRSRCQKVRFRRLTPAFLSDYLKREKGLDDHRAELVAALSFGSLSQAEALLEADFLQERETAIVLLGYLLSQPLAKFWTEFREIVDLRDRRRIDNLILVWQTLFRDLALLLAGADSNCLINRDQLENLQKLAGLVVDFDRAHNALANLLALQKMFYRNLTPATAFFDTADRIKSNQPPIRVRE